MKRQRLDKALVARKICESREHARECILAGDVLVNGIVSEKPARQVDAGASIVLQGEGRRYVSRGGLKLEQALRAFEPPLEGAVCMDIGASTGGFTDCLLQAGVARVYAIDVGYGQLAWKLRMDERVVVLERTNIRHLSADHVPEAVDLAVVDCSFIGLEKVVAPAVPFLAPGAGLVALVKPQFEVGPDGVGKGGVVRDEDIRTAAIDRVRGEVEALGFDLVAGVDCDTHGPSGNVEYLLYATLRPGVSGPASPSA